MKRSCRLGLQRSDVCRFLKNKTGKLIGSLFVVDLFFSSCLFFHHSCLAESCFSEDQKAAQDESIRLQEQDDGILHPLLETSFCSFDLSETIYSQAIILFLVKFFVLFLLIYQNQKNLRRWAGNIVSSIRQGFSWIVLPLRHRKTENRLLSAKLAALKGKFLAQRRLSRQYHVYQKKKLEKISDLCRILIHSHKAGHFLSHSEILKLLKEVRETSFDLQEKNLVTAEIESVSVSDFIQNIQQMLQWDLIKHDINLEIKYESSESMKLSTDPFFLEILLLGFFKSILFYLYKGSKISLSIEPYQDQIQLKIHLDGHVIQDWYPLKNISFDYGGFSLSGKKILSLLQILKASVSSVSSKDFLITLPSLNQGTVFNHDNVVMLKV